MKHEVQFFEMAGHSPAWPLIPKAICELGDAGFGFHPFAPPVWNDTCLADVFDNEVDEAWRYDLMNLIETTPNLIWLLLTKRIGNVMKMTDPARGHHVLPRNVAIGATIANQPEYDRDRMKLWEVKTTLEPLFTFGSHEPLLGRIILDKFAPDWIITGGETDQGTHKARHTDPDNFRYLRDQSRELGRAFFMKQMTRKAEIPDDLKVRQWPKMREDLT